VRGDLVAEASRESFERLLEGGVLEGDDATAIVTDEMVVVLAVGVSGFVTGDAVADVDPLDEPFAAELLENPVDARYADASAVRAQLVEDLLRGQATVLATEKLDDCAAGDAVAVAA
jgi:hypothetical protein